MSVSDNRPRSDRQAAPLGHATLASSPPDSTITWRTVGSVGALYDGVPAGTFGAGIALLVSPPTRRSIQRSINTTPLGISRNETRSPGWRRVTSLGNPT